MEYRFATVDDIESVASLQKRYHVSTVSDEDRPDGFVTTEFTYEQFKSIIEKENGLAIAVDNGKVVAYAMSASWDYWSAWPLFAHMIKDLPSVTYLGKQMSVKNSFQYGPVCVAKEYRGTGVVVNIFEFSRREFKKRFDVMLTFINKTNPRSFKAHTEKVGFEVIKSFEFNNNNYFELGYDMQKSVAKATI